MPFGDPPRVIDRYTDHRTIKLATQLLALTFPRPGELRCAEWPELDFGKAIWTIPPERTKMRREHRIPLLRQAMAKFEELCEITARPGRQVLSIRVRMMHWWADYLDKLRVPLVAARAYAPIVPRHPRS
jgi:integrase